MKRILFARSLAIAFGAAACTVSAFARDVTLAADAHVNASYPTTNFGTIGNLYVGNGNTALLDFNLRSLPSGVTASQISHATLTLFINRVNAGGQVNLAPVNAGWTEAALRTPPCRRLGQ